MVSHFLFHSHQLFHFFFLATGMVCCVAPPPSCVLGCSQTASTQATSLLPPQSHLSHLCFPLLFTIRFHLSVSPLVCLYSGFCIEVMSALTVLVASNVGIPISSTHCKVPESLVVKPSLGALNAPLHCFTCRQQSPKPITTWSCCFDLSCSFPPAANPVLVFFLKLM